VFIRTQAGIIWSPETTFDDYLTLTGDATVRKMHPRGGQKWVMPLGCPASQKALFERREFHRCTQHGAVSAGRGPLLRSDRLWQ